MSRRTIERAQPAFPLGRRRPRAAGSAREVVTAYLKLAKLRIVTLLLITTVPAMVLAERGMPSLVLIAATLFGGTLSAAGANTINQYLDRDIDLIMARTRRRPLPSHRIEPWRALVFGIVLAAAGFAFLWLAVNPLSAVLATAATAFYVFVYTLWLKRRSPQNIVIGGAAGAVPALVGWAAVTGRVGWTAVVMFDIVFLWTPPHFWALALRYQRDYAAARIPMLPVVAGEAETRRQIVLYSLVLVASSLVLAPVGRLGLLYLAVATALGVRFVMVAAQLGRRHTPAAAMALFRFSLVYLALLFTAAAADVLVRHGL